jgi:hypothetical protein
VHHDLPPPDEVMDKILEAAHELSRPQQKLCPVCNAPLIGRNQELVCISDMCRNRIVEDCSDC